MCYKLYNLQSSLVALASAHWSYGFEFHYHTKDLSKWFLWIYRRRRRQSTKRNRFFIKFQNINESASKFINAANKLITVYQWMRTVTYVCFEVKQWFNLLLILSNVSTELILYLKSSKNEWVTPRHMANSHFLWKNIIILC